MKAQLIYITFAISAGAVLPFQAGLNVQLGKAMAQPIFAAFASFFIGTISLGIYLLVLKFDFTHLQAVRSAPAAVWLAGILGAFYVAAVIILASKLGTALTFSLIVAGQIVVSLIFDHYGLLGLPVKHINWERLLGIIFLIAGVVIIRRF